MTTYPNQKVIHINKNKYTANFLQVGIDEWQTAFKTFTPSAFAVYLYLASNADGFDLALSQKAIENALGIKKTAYHSAIEALKKEGYIEVLQGNIEVFHTAPVRKCEPEIIKAKNRKNRKNLNDNVNVNVNDNENVNINENEKKSFGLQANQNSEDAEGTISECGAQFQNVSGAQSENVYNIKEINNNNKKEIDIGDFTPVRKCEPETEEAIFRKNELKSSQTRNTNSAKTNSEVRKNDIEIDNINNINNIDIGDFVASQQNPATSLASQVSSVKQVEAVAADKVITINCSDMRDSYYHLYKYLAKYQPALASFVVNGVAFCSSNKERTNKAIEICNTYGYTINFNDSAAAVAGV